MSRLGQSSIEYLTTYGWMIVAASLAGAALYPTLSFGCDIQIDENTRTGGIAVEQAGITGNGSFQVILDSDTREEVLIESLLLEKDDERIQVVSPQTISPGGEITYPVGQVEKTGSCQDYNVQVNFDKGPLKDQKLNLNIRGSMNLVESFASLLQITGDTISDIEISASVKPTNETLCIGTVCDTTTGTAVQGDEYVNYSGDEMTGTLQTGAIEAGCYGKNCTTTFGSEGGYVNTEDGKMGGTLNVTEIKPLSEETPELDFE